MDKFKIIIVEIHDWMLPYQSISSNYINALSKISKIHSGYRTVFTWYMWRSIDPVDVDY